MPVAPAIVLFTSVGLHATSGYAKRRKKRSSLATIVDVGPSLRSIHRSATSP